MKDVNILPAITLYQPWASWCEWGWKLIETREHERFKSLHGKTIVIHAGKTTDKSSYAIDNPYLRSEQKKLSKNLQNGVVLCTAFVDNFCELNGSHSRNAMIDCYHIRRWGLFLKDVKPFKEKVECDGGMGIWYFDTVTMQKVLKPKGLIIPQKTLFD